MFKRMSFLGLFIGVFFVSLELLGWSLSFSGWLPTMSFLGFFFSAIISYALFSAVIFGGLGWLLNRVGVSQYLLMIGFLWLAIVLGVGASLSSFIVHLLQRGGEGQLLFWAACTIFVCLTFFNVRFWVRRTLIFERVHVRFWIKLGGTCSLLLLSLSILIFFQTRSATKRGLKGDPPVFLISVDHWNASALQDMPRSRSAFESCDEYKRTITLHTQKLPSYGSLLAGRQPWRIPIYNNESLVPKDLHTLSDQLYKEGYNTAMFVSDPLAMRMKSKFQYADRATSLMIQGLDTLFLFQFVSEIHRTPIDTLKQASSFAENQGENPFFAWIQLSALSVDTAQKHQKFLQDLDGELSSFVKEMRTVHPNAIITIVGTQGKVFSADEALSKEALQVPLLFCTKDTKGAVFTQLVRTIDVMNTVLARVPLSIYKKSDGTDLFSLRKNTRFIGFNSIVLVPSEDSNLPAIAAYAANNKREKLYKFIFDPNDKSESLYDLVADPQEGKDIREERGYIRDQLYEKVFQMHTQLQQRKKDTP